MRALVTGEGDLPRMLYDALGSDTVVAEFEGFSSGLPDPIVFRIETIGSLLDALAARGVNEVCFAGGIRRPPLDPARVDAATMPLVPRLMEALAKGDDGALRMVLGLFEERGMAIRAAHELMPELLPPAGVLTEAEPTDRDRRDAVRAEAIHRALAEADVGQACAVAGGQAMAVETFGGTDWMLASLAGSRRPEGPRGGILYKAPKAGQDLRVDVPVVGVSTVEGAAAAGLSGLVLTAGSVMILDRAAVLAACAAHGLFLWVRKT